MSVDLDRLRRLKDLRQQRVRDEPTIAVPHAPAAIRASADGGDLADLVPGHVIETELGSCYLHVNAFALDVKHGPSQLGAVLSHSPSSLAPYHPNFHLDHVSNYRRAVFLDTETTGLGRGSGVYCFMVGVGTFEAWDPTQPDRLPDLDQSPTHFVVRQYFMRNPAEERALLLALANSLAQVDMTVTFNGRTFDLPLLRSRYRHNQRALPNISKLTGLLHEERPHLDLLHPARRLWRRRLQSCRLINLEQKILGLLRSEDDVPGQMIPELYTEYVRSGAADNMRRVFYHNHEDIVTMVALADHICCAFDATNEPSNDERALEDASAQAPTAVRGSDWIGLARAFEASKQPDQAEAAYRRALESVQNATVQAEIYERLGLLYKRQGNWQAAVETWQIWLTSVANPTTRPYVELAKYCEWQTSDFEQAAMWTGWAMHMVRKMKESPSQRHEFAELEHRLKRLKRKLGEPTTG